MNYNELKFDSHPFLNKEANDYLNDSEALRPFRSYPPELQSIKNVIRDRASFPQYRRDILVSVLKEQYAPYDLPADSPVLANIDALSDQKTFTVTAGQQIHIAMGPLFMLYKIMSCIDMAAQLQKLEPEHHFVPIFWMASEDHDFEEINYVKLYGQTYSWDDFQDGAVGRYSTTSLVPLMKELKERLDDNESNNELMDLFTEAYASCDNLAQATQKVIHKLFGHHGLVVLDPDNKDLKSQFTDVIERDIIENINYKPLDDASKAIKDAGYDLQINPQHINNFILRDGKRLKIRGSESGCRLDNGDTLSETEMRAYIRSNPEDFSPNVVLRPVYQETILPNLVYIAGGSELRYWLQLRDVFRENNTFYPLVMPRSSAVVISDRIEEQITQAEAHLSDLFLTEEQLVEKWNNEKESDASRLQKELLEIRQRIAELPPELQRISPQDSPPLKDVGRAEKHIQNIEDWISQLPPEVRNNDKSFKKLLKIKRRFFDDQFPQERIEFCINNLAFLREISGNKDRSFTFSDPKIVNVFVTKSV